MELILYIVFGLVSGIFGGMGMGGGTVLIPLLTIFLGVGQKIAQGYNLLSFLVMAVVAIIIHSKNKLVDWKHILIYIISGLVFCVLGAFLAKLVDTEILHYIFAIFLIILGIYELFSPGSPR